jgi:hypothetical protein
MIYVLINFENMLDLRGHSISIIFTHIFHINSIFFIYIIVFFFFSEIYSFQFIPSNVEII